MRVWLFSRNMWKIVFLTLSLFSRLIVGISCLISGAGARGSLFVFGGEFTPSAQGHDGAGMKCGCACAVSVQRTTSVLPRESHALIRFIFRMLYPSRVAHSQASITVIRGCMTSRAAPGVRRSAPLALPAPAPMPVHPWRAAGSTRSRSAPTRPPFSAALTASSAATTCTCLSSETYCSDSSSDDADCLDLKLQWVRTLNWENDIKTR
jgi:hypothetical protein